MNTPRIFWWQLVAAIALFAPLVGHAAPPSELVVGNGKVIKPGPYAKRAVEVEIDPSGPGRGAGRLAVKMPGGRVIHWKRTGFESRGQGNGVWQGEWSNDADSEAIITVQDGHVFGRFVVGDRVFELQPGARGKHVMRTLKPEAFPACDSGEAEYVVSDDLGEGGIVAASGDAGGTIIDLLSVYTPRVASRLGGQAAAEAMIQAAVDNANAAFANSSMGVQYRLVHAEQVDYTTAGTTSDDLYWVTFDAGVNALRDEVGADMVSIIVDTSGSCGTGWVQRTPSAGFAVYAYQATDMDCAVGNLTFAHEHGHNLGMEHNPENSSVGGSPENASYQHSFAHYVDGSYRTVMSYSAPCSRGCSRVARHSNPDLVYNGSATGISGQRDNAQTGRLTAPIVSEFRTVVTPELPGLNLRVAQGSDDVVQSMSTGEMVAGASTLDLDTDSIVGIRFGSVDVPAGAVITSAFVELSAASAVSAPAELAISAVLADSASPFGSASYALSDLPTGESVTWPVSDWSTGDAKTSPDISPVIQSIVDRAGWAMGNAIALTLESTGSLPTVAHEGSANLAPMLHIEFEVVEEPVNTPPTANFSVSALDLLASFSDRSEDPDGSITAWEWSFGDGASSTSQNPEHAYGVAGTYSVTLTVTDDQGASDTHTSSLTVAEAVLPPTAGFTFSTVDLEASFSDQSSDPDGSLVGWQWNFGDGAISDSQNPLHTYSTAGTYTVTLVVTDDQGEEDSYSASVTVTEPAAPPPPPEPVAPEAPSGLTKATAQEGKGKNKKIVSATLSWSHDVSNTDYLVLEGCMETITGKGKNRQVVCDWAELMSAIPGDTNIVDAPYAERGFHYRIKAVNGVGASPWSNEVKL